VKDQGIITTTRITNREAREAKEVTTEAEVEEMGTDGVGDKDNNEDSTDNSIKIVIMATIEIMRIMITISSKLITLRMEKLQTRIKQWLSNKIKSPQKEYAGPKIVYTFATLKSRFS